MDIAILRQLTGFRVEPTGDLYETFVLVEFLKWMKTVQLAGELYFYRTRSGFEVDLLLETQQGIIGMEIKSRETVAGADILPLRDVAAGLGVQWRCGLIIYRGNKIHKIADPSIWAVPSCRLFIG